MGTKLARQIGTVQRFPIVARRGQNRRVGGAWVRIPCTLFGLGTEWIRILAVSFLAFVFLGPTVKVLPTSSLDPVIDVLDRILSNCMSTCPFKTTSADHFKQNPELRKSQLTLPTNALPLNQVPKA